MTGYDAVKKLADGLGLLASPLTSVIGWFKSSEVSVEDFQDRFDEMDQDLARTVKSGAIGEASNSFNAFEAEMRKAGLTTEEIAEALPEYAAALEDADEEQRQIRKSAELAAEKWRGMASAMDEVLGKLDELRGETASVGEASDRLAEQQQQTAEAVAAAAGQLDSQTEAGRKARDALRNQSDALFDWLKAQEEAGGAAFDLSGEYQKAYSEMAAVIGEQTGLAGEALETYLEQLGYVPPEKVTEMELDKKSAEVQLKAYIFGDLDAVPDEIETLAEWTDEDAKEAVFSFQKYVQETHPEFVITEAQLDDLDAITDIDELREYLLGLERTYKAKVEISAEVDERIASGGAGWYNWELSQVTGSAEGGPVFGPGGPKDDKAGLFALSNGEYVLSAAAVKFMGGISAVDEFHRAAKGGIRDKPDTSFNPYNPNAMSVGEQAIVEELRAMRTQDMTNSGMAVNIGSISSGSPEETASEIITSMRAERWRLGAMI